MFSFKNFAGKMVFGGTLLDRKTYSLNFNHLLRSQLILMNITYDNLSYHYFAFGLELGGGGGLKFITRTIYWG
jgi:hypothetical protein